MVLENLVSSPVDHTKEAVNDPRDIELPILVQNRMHMQFWSETFKNSVLLKFIY